jgi:type I restriction enzyme S subunit
MKAGWQSKKLGEVCEIRGGGTPSKAVERYWKGEIPWVSPKDMKFDVVSDSIDHISQEAIDGSATSMIPKDAVLMVVRSGILARIVPIAITGRPLTINQDLKALCPNRTVSAQFLVHFLNSKMDALLSMVSRGATVHRLETEHIRSLDFLFPPLEEQKRIVAILDEAFAGIATAKANTEKNLQNARALFESHLQAVFTQRGEGWVEKRLGDESLLEIVDGDRGTNYPKASDFQDQGHCLFLNTKNVRPDGFEFESTMFISADKDRQLRKGKLRRGDVVLTTRGTIGNIGLYSDEVPFDNVRINSGMLVLRPNRSVLLSSFLFELMRSEIVREQIRKQTTGAAQPQLPIKTLVSFKIPVPVSLDAQLALVTKLRELEPETQRLEAIYQRKLDALDALKRSLLHRAFSGDLTRPLPGSAASAQTPLQESAAPSPEKAQPKPPLSQGTEAKPPIKEGQLALL